MIPVCTGRSTPPRTTYFTVRNALVPAAGSASRTSRSASLPASTVPSSSSRRIAIALPFVALTKTSIGVRPAASIASISA